MDVIRWIVYSMIFGVSTSIGVLLAKKYENRVDELKDFKSAFIILKTKMKYTYLPLKEIFKDIVNCTNGKTKEVFEKSCQYIDNEDSTNSWNKAIQNTVLNITKEDKNAIMQFGKMLGKTDTDGQISQIDLTISFLDMQIEKAETDKQKNAKLYKTLGAVTGIGIIIILL